MIECMFTCQTEMEIVSCVAGSHLPMQSASLWVSGSLCGRRTVAALHPEVQSQQKLRLYVRCRHQTEGKTLSNVKLFLISEVNSKHCNTEGKTLSDIGGEFEAV